MHILSVSAKIINVILQQKRSVLKNAITQKSWSFKKNIEIEVRFLELNSLFTLLEIDLLLKIRLKDLSNSQTSFALSLFSLYIFL